MLNSYQGDQLRKCEFLGFQSSAHSFLGLSDMDKQDERGRHTGKAESFGLVAPWLITEEEVNLQGTS